MIDFVWWTELRYELEEGNTAQGKQRAQKKSKKKKRFGSLRQPWCLLQQTPPFCIAISLVFTYLLHVFGYPSLPFSFLRYTFKSTVWLVPKPSCSNCHRCSFSLCNGSPAFGWMTNSRSIADLPGVRLVFAVVQAVGNLAFLSLSSSV